MRPSSVPGVDELGQQIRALPGAERLLPALDGLAPAWLVGGAVRDLLLGARSVDLDVAIEGDAREVGRELAARLGGVAVEHERFGTATVRSDGLTVDLASTRRESYRHPGALPDVEPAGLDEDLARRDFTVNAMAASLAQDRLGELRDPHGGRSDLDAGVIRVLHPNSFVDDPTRLLRAVRYEARLGFRMDPDTERLAREAIAAGAPSTVSGARIRDELLDLLGETAASSGSSAGETAEASASGHSPAAGLAAAHPPAPAVARMADLGLDRALSPLLGDAKPDDVAAAADAAEARGGERRFAALAAMIASDPDDLAGFIEDLNLRAEDRDAVLHAARKGPQLVRSLETQLPDSALHALLHCELPETFGVALALGARPAPIDRYLEHLSRTGLEITGDDLRAAGIPEGPAIGRALRETLRRKLDGEITGYDAELALAVGLAREDA
jgi:tRNA nucleotidyltransferase (CCA-adding enzyme)